MKTLRKNGGFTLVELIVVIAILAILAGVAVPAYSGYIKKAEDAKVVTELSAVNTAAQAAAAGEGATVSNITINVDTIQKTATITVGAKGAADADITIDYAEMANLLGNGATGTNTGVTYASLGKSMSASDTYKNGASWSDGTWTATSTTSN